MEVKGQELIPGLRLRSATGITKQEKCPLTRRALIGNRDMKKARLCRTSKYEKLPAGLFDQNLLVCPIDN